jgi:hypothetical protein
MGACVVGAMMGSVSHGIAAEQNLAAPRPLRSGVALPRAFQQARLGMPIQEAIPMGASATKSHRVPRVLVRKANDPYIDHLEYHFHDGVLYALHIYYKPDRLVQGVSGFLDRLKAIYGEPEVEGDLAFDPAPGIWLERKTVWRDERTRISLTERERRQGITDTNEVALEMTDIALENLKRETERRRQLERIQGVPIPLPDGVPSKETAEQKRTANNRNDRDGIGRSTG